MSYLSKIKKNILNKRYPLIPYVPKSKSMPANMLQVTSAWKGLESIIEDILDHFDIARNSCIEFGVEFGFSTVVFSNYFTTVIGVDTFLGDEHTIHEGDHYDQTKKSLANYQNIQLIQSDYQRWIKKDNEQYDFSHVDIVHNYKETYECGLWAAQHSKCTVFHDTESFPAVKKAVFNIAKKTGKKAYNYPYHHGLGIIV